MRALCVLLAVVATAQANAYDHFTAPNGKFEAYTAAQSPDGGMNLFLRRARARAVGLLLWQSARWIDAKWSPDSRFLAVIDHPDGHIADVYVFRVVAADAAPMLLYHTTPLHKYDVRWDIIGWDTESREIVLKQEVRDQNAGTHATHTVVAKIGRKPLKFELPK